MHCNSPSCTTTLPTFLPPATRSRKEFRVRRSVRECQSAQASHARTRCLWRLAGEVVCSCEQCAFDKIASTFLSLQ